MRPVERARERLRAERGFGLVELTIAMTMLMVGLLTLVAAFSSGYAAINHASTVSTASVLADKTMERYRAITYDQIALSSSAVAAADSTYANDSALSGASDITEAAGAPAATQCSGSPLPTTCNPSRAIPDTVTGEVAPDGRDYRIDTYITWACPSSTATLGGTTSNPTCADGGISLVPVKHVTVVVRDGTSLRTLAREDSIFDSSIGS